MKSELRIAASLEHNEPLAERDIETMEHFIKCGIEEIIDGSQDYKVERVTITQQPAAPSEEASFTEL